MGSSCIFFLMPSLHSRFSKGKGKEDLGSMHKGERRRGMSTRIQDASSLFFISAKIKHLWKSGCQMASNQECLQQKLSPKCLFVFLAFFFFFYKQSQYIWSKVLKRPNAELPNEENCNNVCRVGEITLKVEYSNTNSIATALKLKKELFSVI